MAMKRRANGEGDTDHQGYVWVSVEGEQRRQHVLVAEKAMGRLLPAGAQVHHINGNRADNRNENLLVCPSAAYHNEIHRKMRVRSMGGDPWTQRWCGKCQRLLSESMFAKKYATRFRSPCRECGLASSKTRSTAWRLARKTQAPAGF
jgi:hypothetical protein